MHAVVWNDTRYNGMHSLGSSVVALLMLPTSPSSPVCLPSVLRTSQKRSTRRRMELASARALVLSGPASWRGERERERGREGGVVSGGRRW